jgi:fucose 4-O-acetylase-like acetyltransferase
MPFGTHSLTVYIIHGVVILLLSYLLPTSQSIIVNTLTGIIAIMGALLLLKIPWVTRFIPR